MKKTLWLTLLVIFNAGLSFSQDLTGDWFGSLQVFGQDIPLVLHLQQEGDSLHSTLDSPSQQAFGITANKTLFQNAGLFIEFAALNASYQGRFDATLLVFEGTFTQNGLEIPLTFSRAQKRVDKT